MPRASQGPWQQGLAWNSMSFKEMLLMAESTQLGGPSAVMNSSVAAIPFGRPLLSSGRSAAILMAAFVSWRRPAIDFPERPITAPA